MSGSGHGKVLGILFLIYGGMQLLGLIGGIVGILLFGGVALVNASGRDAAPLFIVFAIIIGILLVVALLVLPTLLAGWKLFREKTSGKVWVIIAAILALFNIPLGTALGIYALWFVFGDEGRKFYNRGSMSGSFNPPSSTGWR